MHAVCVSNRLHERRTVKVMNEMEREKRLLMKAMRGLKLKETIEFDVKVSGTTFPVRYRKEVNGSLACVTRHNPRRATQEFLAEVMSGCKVSIRRFGNESDVEQSDEQLQCITCNGPCLYIHGVRHDVCENECPLGRPILGGSR